MKLNKRAVWKRVCRSWFNSILTMLVISGLSFLLALLGARLVGPRIVLGLLIVGAFIGILFFLLSPLVVIMILQLRPANPEKDQRFINSVNKAIGSMWMLHPKLYIMNIPLPNACAFGWGLWRGIAASPQLIAMMDDDELSGISGHEVAHLRCRDVGLATLAAILTSVISGISRTLQSGKTILGKGPMAYLFMGLFWVCEKTIVPLLRATLMQQREFTADALSALYCGSPKPLIRGLRKLESSLPAASEDSPFSDLMATHPVVKLRIAELELLEA